MTATTPSSRIGQLDAVRGMAILGIILMNIFAFALPQAAYLNPYYTNKTPDSEAYLWGFSMSFSKAKFSLFFNPIWGNPCFITTPFSSLEPVPSIRFSPVRGDSWGWFWDGDTFGLLTGLLVTYLLNQYEDGFY